MGAAGLCSAQYCRLVLWDAGGLGFMENGGQGKNVSASVDSVEKKNLSVCRVGEGRYWPHSNPRTATGCDVFLIPAISSV